MTLKTASRSKTSMTGESVSVSTDAGYMILNELYF